MNEDTIACPDCGKADTLDGFDRIGADGDHVFCTACHCEFHPATGIRRDPKQGELFS